MIWLFRVWNPITQKMVYDINEINLGSGVIANVEDGKIIIQYRTEENSWTIATPQFYSGLVDSERKKIFANDIIEVNEKFLRGKRFKVLFKNGCFGFRNGVNFVPLYKYEWTLYKVIGNADANPELLEV